MKKPREILLNRHRAVDSKLDRVREQVLADELVSPASTVQAVAPDFRSLLAAVVNKSWTELVWPYRRAWAGLAAIWIILLAMNLSDEGAGQSAVSASFAQSPEVLTVLKQQRELLAEFVQANPQEPADKPRELPRPRSQKAVPWMIG